MESPDLTKRNRFRTEIQGLRGIAVIAVLIFHLSPAVLPGGFLGVDVFLVISGFLITSQLLAAIDKNEFSLLYFYLRRVFRIIPSLVSVLTIFFPIIAYVYAPQDLDNIKDSIIAALLGVSNFLFAGQSSYFQTSENVRPFLHTWSLSLEIQFYAIWPLIIWVASVFHKSSLKIVTAFLFLTSFFTTYFIQDRRVRFFLLPTRLFEFLVGGLLSFNQHPPTSNTFMNVCSGSSFSFLLVAFLLLDEKMPLPGVPSLFICIFTAMIIYSGPKTVASKICSCAPLSFCGKISYSIYLVHWPLIVILKYVTDEKELSITSKLIVSIISVALGFVNYSLVENNKSIRIFATKNAKQKIMVVISVYLFIISASTIVANMYRQTNRDSRQLEVSGELEAIRSTIDSTISGNSVGHYGNSFGYAGSQNSSRKYLLMGDSFAGHLYKMVHYFGLKYNISFTILWVLACPPLFGVTGFIPPHVGEMSNIRWKRCLSAQKFWKSFIQERRYEGVIIASRWSTWIESAGEYSNRGFDKEMYLFNNSFSRENGLKLTYGTENPSKEQRRKYLMNTLTSTVNIIKRSSHAVLIVTEPPDIGRDMEQCRRAIHTGGNVTLFDKRGIPLSHEQPLQCVEKNRTEVKLRLINALQIIRNVVRLSNCSLLNPTKYFCDDEKIKESIFCRSTYGNNLLYKDSSHLSKMGSIFLALEWDQDSHAKTLANNFFIGV